MERATDFVHQLDARQRAMLKAMGITVWAPTPEKAPINTPAESPSPVAKTPAPAAAAPADYSHLSDEQLLQQLGGQP